jgi:hypothetical protein
MNNNIEMEDCMVEAFGKIEDFIMQATKIKPEPQEIASALSKYFVLKEILSFVELERQQKSLKTD